MNKVILLSISLACISLSSCDGFHKVVNAAGTILTTPSGLSNDEASGGIKEALGNGLSVAVLNLNRKDGFLGNDFYKLLLPPDAQKVERTMRGLGLSKPVDRAIESINRGAEDAVGFAKDIFVTAIKQMTLADALSIVRGGQGVATQYFKQKTTAQLIAAFTPSVQASLQKVNATKFYGDVINNYNTLVPPAKKINPDLTSYVVEKTTDALFDQIAKEENNIRANPVARTTDLLKKVFGQPW